MTNDEKILDILLRQAKTLEKQEKALESLQEDVKDLKQTQAEQGKKLDAVQTKVDSVQADVTILKADVNLVKDFTAHTNTAIKALATKQDVERVEKEVDKLKRSRPHRAD